MYSHSSRGDKKCLFLLLFSFITAKFYHIDPENCLKLRHSYFSKESVLISEEIEEMLRPVHRRFLEMHLDISLQNKQKIDIWAIDRKQNIQDVMCKSGQVTLFRLKGS